MGEDCVCEKKEYKSAWQKYNTIWILKIRKMKNKVISYEISRCIHMYKQNKKQREDVFCCVKLADELLIKSGFKTVD